MGVWSMAEQSPILAYIGLGSNLPHAGQSGVELLSSALDDLASHPNITLACVSHFYSTSAVVATPKDTVPDYCNAVAQIKTTLPPEQLLGVLQGVELAHGRTRTSKMRWQARTLDLDLLLYGDKVIALPYLTVPHPELAHRSFVLQPLKDIQTLTGQKINMPTLGFLDTLITQFETINSALSAPQKIQCLQAKYTIKNH